MHLNSTQALSSWQSESWKHSCFGVSTENANIYCNYKLIKIIENILKFRYKIHTKASLSVRVTRASWRARTLIMSDCIDARGAGSTGERRLFAFVYVSTQAIGCEHKTSRTNTKTSEIVSSAINTFLILRTRIICRTVHTRY